MKAWAILPILLVATSLYTGAVQAQAKKAAPKKAATPARPGKVDISDLENKYWAPKDTDFSVVQNRMYTKEKRFSLSLGLGVLVNDNWSEGRIYEMMGNYYFNERYGVEASIAMTDLKEAEVLSDMANFGGGVRANHGRVESMYEVGFNWVPFYAKMSLLGKKIVYFDMMFTPTIGMVGYEQQLQYGNNKKESTISYGFNISQHFFLNKNITIRADLKNRWFNEKRRNWLQSTGHTSVGDVFNNTTTFTIGLQYFF